uniref:PNPLA domain-containing protein n=1 Tax=Strongyloides papillosus TaxID=174720 RepID=A0A0N5C5X8_STREA
MPRYPSSSYGSDETTNSTTSYTEESNGDSSESSSGRSRSVSPVSTSSSTDNVTTTSSNKRESLKQYIEGSFEKYEKPDEDTVKLLEEIAKRIQPSKFVEPPGSFTDSILRKIYGDPNAIKSDKEDIFKNAHKKTSDELVKLCSIMTGDDVVTAIHNCNITGIIYAYIADNLKKDYRDDNNNNYLHIGMKVNHGLTMKTLLLLIDDSRDLLTQANNDGDYPIDLVKSDEMRIILLEFASQRISISDMRPDQRFRIAMIGELTKNKVDKVTKDSKIMISLDGGGIRGLCTTQILMAIEKKMKNKKLWENVDWVVGTSTGGMLALALSLGKSFHDARKMYFKLKDEVLPKAYYYSGDSKKIESLLQELMGEYAAMDTIKNKKIAIATVKSKKTDDGKNVLKLFRNYQLAEVNNNDDRNKGKGRFFNEDFGYDNPSHNYIWKVARCTSAVPFYFDSFGEYIDGGALSNNPSIDLLADYFNYYHLETLNNNGQITNKIADDIFCFISLGTGGTPSDINKVVENELDTINSSQTHSLKKGINVIREAWRHFTQSIEPDGLPVDRSSAWCHSLRVPFFRIQPILEQSAGFMEKNNEKIIQMLWETENYLKSVCYYEIEALANYLDVIIERREELREEDGNN